MKCERCQAGETSNPQSPGRWSPCSTLCLSCVEATGWTASSGAPAPSDTIVFVPRLSLMKGNTVTTGIEEPLSKRPVGSLALAGSARGRGRGGSRHKKWRGLVVAGLTHEASRDGGVDYTLNVAHDGPIAADLQSSVELREAVEAAAPVVLGRSDAGVVCSDSLAASSPAANDANASLAGQKRGRGPGDSGEQIGDLGSDSPGARPYFHPRAEEVPTTTPPCAAGAFDPATSVGTLAATEQSNEECAARTTVMDMSPPVGSTLLAPSSIETSVLTMRPPWTGRGWNAAADVAMQGVVRSASLRFSVGPSLGLARTFVSRVGPISRRAVFDAISVGLGALQSAVQRLEVPASTALATEVVRGDSRRCAFCGLIGDLGEWPLTLHAAVANADAASTSTDASEHAMLQGLINAGGIEGLLLPVPRVFSSSDTLGKTLPRTAATQSRKPRGKAPSDGQRCAIPSSQTALSPSRGPPKASMDTNEAASFAPASTALPSCDWVHAGCALWSATVNWGGSAEPQPGVNLHTAAMSAATGTEAPAHVATLPPTLVGVQAGVRSSRRLNCSLCGCPGASISCVHRNCSARYHLRCAIIDGAALGFVTQLAQKVEPPICQVGETMMDASEPSAGNLDACLRTHMEQVVADSAPADSSRLLLALEERGPPSTENPIVDCNSVSSALYVDRASLVMTSDEPSASNLPAQGDCLDHSAAAVRFDPPGSVASVSTPQQGRCCKHPLLCIIVSLTCRLRLLSLLMRRPT